MCTVCRDLEENSSQRPSVHHTAPPSDPFSILGLGMLHLVSLIEMTFVFTWARERIQGPYWSVVLQLGEV